MSTPDYSFLFTGPEGTLSGVGSKAAWHSVDQALAGLSEGAPLVAGALPFHTTEPPALFSPVKFWFSPGAPALPQGEVPVVTGTESTPEPEEHARRVQEATERIRGGEFEKIVLARAVRYRLAAEADARVLLSRFLAGSGTGHGHLVSLDSAGAAYSGARLVGSSPELLLLKRGRYIESHPLAGTVARSADPVRDEALATELTLSAKNIEEHSYVTREIKRILQPWCAELEVPERPSLTATSHTWHLGTRIRGMLREDAVSADGRLRGGAISALELAAALHPTPAVCGYPTIATQAALRAEEPQRGFYAGAVGWADDRGNGEWRVTIRGAMTQGAHVLAHAGGGIVADSDPQAEVQETQVKLGPVRAVLGLND
ncbi:MULTISPECIES: isochorismate synthase MenF [unclassified Corynebacterium]|uniref:isochorismate synthase n=1 Tax=unclassified Corynebacterium TaxID=2624378 RepID=UPI0029CA8D8E|nr:MULTISPECIES: chorismate-binding protein [unclassified Corynebacterium]WPF66269.1 chorismate-binding protein [Corynebacterium sp. 22KM0430]WPF68759.1 chorismate-binding protein [Corynebacterium sp. 21KM1197]